MSSTPATAVADRENASQRVPPRWAAAWPIVFAAALPLGLFLLQGRIGISLSDEGFLWYGAQRVLAGELPLRDFQSYDIGRYFWSAAWMLITGDQGILALRLGNALLATLTVGLATLVVRSANPKASPLFVALCGVIFTTWMVPDFKVADSFAAVLLLFGVARVLQVPTTRRWAELGVCLGVAADIGINHALYGSLATIMLLIFLRFAPGAARSILALAVGGLIGYAPVLALVLFAPGFTEGFVDNVRQILEAGTTNIPLPFPRLSAFTRASYAGLLNTTEETLMAILMFVTPLFWGLAAWRLRTRECQHRVGPAFAAGLILSVPYAHYAISRFDLAHVALSVLPLLVAFLAWASGAGGRIRDGALLIIVGASVAMTAQSHRGFGFLRGHPYETVTILGERIWAAPLDAGQVRVVQHLAQSGPPGPIYVAPYMPGAYALVRQRAPTWEIYLLFPANEQRQEREILRLRAADVRKALIAVNSVDGRADLGFSATHPMIAAYVWRCLPHVEPIEDLAPDLTIREAPKPVCGRAVSDGRTGDPDRAVRGKLAVVPRGSAR